MHSHEHRWAVVTEQVGGFVVAPCIMDGCTAAKTVPYIPSITSAERVYVLGERVPMPQYMLDAGHFEGLDSPWENGSMDRTLERAAQQVMADLANNGGGTYWQGTLLPFTPTVGYAVGIGGIKLPAGYSDARAIAWGLRIAAKEFDTPFVGTWLNGNDVHLDAVEYFGPDRFVAAVNAGVNAGQLAIYDFANGEAIDLTPDMFTTEDHDR